MSDITPTRQTTRLDAVRAALGRTFIRFDNAIEFENVAHLNALLAPISSEIVELLNFASETPDLAARLTAVEAGVAKAMDVRTTVANEAARLALTLADVQNGDFVAQTTPARLFEVVNDTLLGTGSAADAFKEWSTGDIEALAYTIASSATQTVTITKMLTIINVTPPASGSAFVDLGTSGPDGAIVVVQRMTTTGLGGTVHIRTRLQDGTTVATVTSLVSGSGNQPMRAIVQRVNGTPTNVLTNYYSTVLRTNQNGQIENVKATATTALFYAPSLVAISANGATSSVLELRAPYGGAPNDGDSIEISLADSGGTPTWGPIIFEFDSNASLVNGSATSVSFGSSWADAFSSLSSSLSGAGFSGSVSVGTGSDGSGTYEFIRLTSSAFSIGCSNSSGASAAIQTNAVAPTSAGVFNTVASGLINLVVQHGPNGGLAQPIDIFGFDGSTQTQIGQVPSGGSANTVLDLKDVLSSSGLSWLFSYGGSTSASIQFSLTSSDSTPDTLTRILATVAAPTVASVSISTT